MLWSVTSKRRQQLTKVVLLDVDGTLMDTNYLHTEAWARAFEGVGLRVPRNSIHRRSGRDRTS
jgi:beta-phosphoglucomutase-like phosphatase (HAD superfamily)